MTIDFHKPLQTKDGRKVRILCTDRKHVLYPVMALVMNADGSEMDNTFTMTGKYYEDGREHHLDLENVPETTEKFYNISFEGLDSEGRPILRAGFARGSVANAQQYGIANDRVIVLKVTEQAGNRKVEVAHTY